MVYIYWQYNIVIFYTVFFIAYDESINTGFFAEIIDIEFLN